MRPLFLWSFLWLFLAESWLMAGELPPPPPLAKEPVEEVAYLRAIHRHHNNWVVETANPNGSRAGEVGDLLAFNNAGSWKLCLNTDGGTTWQCSANALTAP